MDVAALPHRLQRNSRARHRRRLVGPVLASGLRVERVDGSVSAAEKESAAGDDRLRRDHRRASESECPFQFESSDLLPVEARGLGGLKTAVGQVHAPPRPGCFAEGYGKLRGRAAARWMLRLHACAARQVTRQRQPLGPGQNGPLRFHRASLERRQDLLFGDQLERGGKRRAYFAARLVAAGAMFRKKRRRILR